MELLICSDLHQLNPRESYQEEVRSFSRNQEV
jgi:hypothetical protein